MTNNIRIRKFPGIQKVILTYSFSIGWDRFEVNWEKRLYETISHFLLESEELEFWLNNYYEYNGCFKSLLKNFNEI